jgi:hypothetical protein
MRDDTPLPPAFGEADLSNCERELIHLPGSIQPHGVVLVLSPDGRRILQASANTAALMGVPADRLLDGSLEGLGGDLPGRIRTRIRDGVGGEPLPLRGTLAPEGVGPRGFEALLHRNEVGADPGGTRAGRPAGSGGAGSRASPAAGGGGGGAGGSPPRWMNSRPTWWPSTGRWPATTASWSTASMPTGTARWWPKGRRSTWSPTWGCTIPRPTSPTAPASCTCGTASASWWTSTTTRSPSFPGSTRPPARSWTCP